MRWADRLELWSHGWRGPFLAAMVALVAGLPGLIALPPLDRDESRFAEATVQMLESGDFVTIHFQDQPRFKKPVGIYWLQAAAISLLSHAEDRGDMGLSRSVDPRRHVGRGGMRLGVCRLYGCASCGPCGCDAGGQFPAVDRGRHCRD